MDSVFLLVFAMGTYLPIINFIAVVILGRIILAMIKSKEMAHEVFFSLELLGYHHIFHDKFFYITTLFYIYCLPFK